MLNSIKNTNCSKDVKNDQLASIFRDQIKDKYGTIYQKHDKQHILSELKGLEKSTFIKQELFSLADMMEIGKQKCNEIKHKQKLKNKQIAQQFRQLEKYSQNEASEKQINEYQQLKAEDKQLQNQLDTMLYENQQLEFMLEKRRLIVKEYLRDNKDEGIRLDKIKWELETYAARITKIHEDIHRQAAELKKAAGTKGRNIREVFGDKLMAEIGKFEETNAIKEIFKNEDQMQQIQQKEQQIKKGKDKELQQEETKRSLAKIREERKQMEGVLTEMRQKIVQLKQASKVQDVQELEDVQTRMRKEREDMLEISEQFDRWIEGEQSEIDRLIKEKEELECHQEVERERKIEQVEVELRTTGEEEQNLTDKSVQLEKTIDRCCLLVSRVKYQLGSFYNYQIKQGDVDMTNLHEQFSQCGLMLEKMLTVLFQKSHLINLQVESINTDNQYNRPPQAIALNNQIYARMTSLQRDTRFNTNLANEEAQEKQYIEQLRTTLRSQNLQQQKQQLFIQQQMNKNQ